MQKIITEHAMSIVEITICIWDIVRKPKAFKIVAQCVVVFFVCFAHSYSSCSVQNHSKIKHSSHNTFNKLQIEYILSSAESYSIHLGLVITAGLVL